VKVHLCLELWTPDSGLVTAAFKLKRKPIQVRLCWIEAMRLVGIRQDCFLLAGIWQDCFLLADIWQDSSHWPVFGRSAAKEAGFRLDHLK
jgi:hypothetical protein